MRRIFTASLVVLAASAFAGCAGAPCNDEPPVMQVFDDPPSAVACDPCANGQCAVPQARIVAPAVVGEYGYVLGRPGFNEGMRSAFQIPGSIIECGGTALGEVGVVAGRFVRCVGANLWPEPAASRQLVRLERVQRGPMIRTRARATDPCGRPMPGPQQPPPPPPPDGEPPPSIPATRRN